MPKLALLRFYAYLASFLTSVSAFSVTFGTPSQCDPFTVSWSGGQAPFEILLTPRFSPLLNISVPSSAFSNGKGSYTIPQLPFTNKTQLLLTMSDGSGFATGGTTTLLTVGMPVENNNCNTKLTQDFTFQLPSALKQCDLYNFTAYDGAIQPITIGALIPGGMATLLHPPNGTNYSWTVDVAAGTSLLFFIVDSQGRQGGVSDLETAAASTDGSCLVANALSSTVSVASLPTSSQSTFASSSNTTNAGVIAGATVGSVVFVALLILLGMYCRRRMSRSSNTESYPVQLPHKDDSNEVKHYKQTFTSQLQTGRQPGVPSHLENVPASESLAHLRQMSLTDSFAGSSSISSATRPVAGVGGQTSPYTFTHQALPAGLAPPVHPAHHISAGTVIVDAPNSNSFTGYGDTSIPSPSRRAVPFPRQISPNYSFPYQAPPASYLTPPGTGPYHSSADSSAVSDPPSPTNPTQPPHLNSNIERFTRLEKPGSTSPGTRTAVLDDQYPTEFIMHTDVADVPAASNTKNVVELPPQYADRDRPAAPPTS